MLSKFQFKVVFIFFVANWKRKFICFPPGLLVFEKKPFFSFIFGGDLVFFAAL